MVSPIVQHVHLLARLIITATIDPTNTMHLPRIHSSALPHARLKLVNACRVTSTRALQSHAPPSADSRPSRRCECSSRRNPHTQLPSCTTPKWQPQSAAPRDPQWSPFSIRPCGMHPVRSAPQCALAQADQCARRALTLEVHRPSACCESTCQSWRECAHVQVLEQRIGSILTRHQSPYIRSRHRPAHARRESAPQRHPTRPRAAARRMLREYARRSPKIACPRRSCERSTRP